MSDLENLKSIFSNVNEWLKFAEAKNLTLLTIDSAIIIGIFQIDFTTNTILQSIIFYIIVPALFASGLISLFSLSPILAKIKKQNNSKSLSNWIANMIDDESIVKNIHFFGYLRTLSKDDFMKDYQNKMGVEKEISFNGFEKDLIDQILYNSRITWLKYRLFKYSIFLSSLSLIIGSSLIILSKIFGLWK